VLTVRLDKKARTLIRRARRTRIRVGVTVTTGGRVVSDTRTFVLKLGGVTRKRRR
jgi:hypothetical protein